MYIIYFWFNINIVKILFRHFITVNLTNKLNFSGILDICVDFILLIWRLIQTNLRECNINVFVGQGISRCTLINWLNLIEIILICVCVSRTLFCLCVPYIWLPIALALYTYNMEWTGYVLLWHSFQIGYLNFTKISCPNI